MNSTTQAKVTLCCKKDHERRAYHQDEVYFRIVDILRSLDPSIPVHLIFGQRLDAMYVHHLVCLGTIAHICRPQYVYDSVLSMRQYASIQRVPKAGHFVSGGSFLLYT